jgi:hypothetical protein
MGEIGRPEREVYAVPLGKPIKPGRTVTELLEALAEIPGDWLVVGTTQGSLMVREPEGRIGMRYAYVFPDGRPTRFYTAKR